MARTFDGKIYELMELKNSIDISKLQKNKEICLKQLNNLLGGNMLNSNDDRVKSKMMELNHINDKIKLADKIAKDIDFLEKRREKIRKLPIYSKTTKWVYSVLKDDSVYKYAKRYGRKDIINKLKDRTLSIDEYERIYLEANYPNLSQIVLDNDLWNNVDLQKGTNISSEKILDELWVSYRMLNWEIIPPEESKKIIKWSWVWFNVQSNMGKLNILFTDILGDEKGFSQKDFDIVTGVVLKNRIRKLSYVAVKIQKLNKTILINENHGEATYIFDGILWDDDLLNIKKSSMGENFHKIIFTTVESWKSSMCGYLWIKTKSQLEEEEKNERKMEVERQNIINILKTPEMREEWSKLNVCRNRRVFHLPNLEKTSYLDIARAFWFSKKEWRDDDHDIRLDDELYSKLTKKIFWEDFFVENEEGIRRVLYNKDIIKNRFNLTQPWLRMNFRLSNNLSYKRIARKFWFKNREPEIFSYDIYKKLWEKIYWEDYEKFAEQYWIEEKYKKFVSENFIKWFRMTKKRETLLNFDFNGKNFWFITMCNLILWDEYFKSNQYDEKNHINITKKLFLGWELSETLKIQQDLIISELRNNNKFKEKRFKTKPWNFHRIRFDWELNYVSLVRIILFNQWINGNWDFDIYWISTYNQLTKIIFW